MRGQHYTPLQVPLGFGTRNNSHSVLDSGYPLNCGDCAGMVLGAPSELTVESVQSVSCYSSWGVLMKLVLVVVTFKGSVEAVGHQAA